MKNRIVTTLIIVNLVAIFFLVFQYPQFMVSPGELIKGHQKLATDCFACHRLGMGSPASQCITCHTVEKIGKVTTQGLPVKKKEVLVSFHQDLIEQDCVACHSDHRGVKIYRVIKQFSHELLMESTRKNCKSCHQGPQDPLHQKVSINCDLCHTQEQWKPTTFKHELLMESTRKNCKSCHQGPQDPLHQKVSVNCDLCHTQEQWKPTTFKHELLTEPVRSVCEACHQGPEDSLHRKIVGTCVRCHSEKQWSPATFEHDKYFRLDSDHDTDCVTCHEDNNYQNYSCYGCHEHTPSGMRDKHYEEGIYDYENCTKCHHSADEDEIEYSGSSHTGPQDHSFDNKRENKHEKEND